MLEELFGTSPASTPAHLREVLVRIALSLVMGFAGMLVYRFARAGEPRNRSFEITLVLLSILIAMVTQVIGDSVARAFSLVGALSIVRFRTVVRDTQDTAYVIFAVVLGMAVGADLLMVALVGLLIVIIAVALLRKRGANAIWAADQNGVLEIRVPLGNSLEQISQGIFKQHLDSFQLTGLTTAKQGVALEATYTVRLKPATTPTELVRDLNKFEGVQSVALHSADSLER